MKMRRLDEILEECLTAYLDQGRSVEESLQLHSAYRGQLEPLLRTALEVSSTFQSYSPPDRSQERGLARFLSDARARKNLRTLTAEPKRGFFSGLFSPQRRLGLVGVTAAIAVTAIAIGAASFSGGTNGSGEDTSVINPRTPTPTNVAAPSGSTVAPRTPQNVRSLQAHVTAIQQRVDRGEIPDASEIASFTAAATLLKETPSGDIDSVRTTIAETIQQADTLLQTIAETHPEAAPAVEEARVTTRDVAAVFDIPLPSGTPPVSTPVTGDTSTPTDGPAVTPTAPPTDAPTATPAPTEAPTDIPAPTAEPTTPDSPTTRPIGLP